MRVATSSGELRAWQWVAVVVAAAVLLPPAQAAPSGRRTLSQRIRDLRANAQELRQKSSTLPVEAQTIRPQTQANFLPMSKYHSTQRPAKHVTPSTQNLGKALPLRFVPSTQKPTYQPTLRSKYHTTQEPIPFFVGDDSNIVVEPVTAHAEVSTEIDSKDISHATTTHSISSTQEAAHLPTLKSKYHSVNNSQRITSRPQQNSKEIDIQEIISQVMTEPGSISATEPEKSVFINEFITVLRDTDDSEGEKREIVDNEIFGGQEKILRGNANAQRFDDTLAQGIHLEHEATSKNTISEKALKNDAQGIQLSPENICQSAHRQIDNGVSQVAERKKIATSLVDTQERETDNASSDIAATKVDHVTTQSHDEFKLLESIVGDKSADATHSMTNEVTLLQDDNNIRDTSTLIEFVKKRKNDSREVNTFDQIKSFVRPIEPVSSKLMTETSGPAEIVVDNSIAGTVNHVVISKHTGKSGIDSSPGIIGLESLIDLTNPVMPITNTFNGVKIIENLDVGRRQNSLGFVADEMLIVPSVKPQAGRFLSIGEKTVGDKPQENALGRDERQFSVQSGQVGSLVPTPVTTEHTPLAIEQRFVPQTSTTTVSTLIHAMQPSTLGGDGSLNHAVTAVLLESDVSEISPEEENADINTTHELIKLVNIENTQLDIGPSDTGIALEETNKVGPFLSKSAHGSFQDTIGSAVGENFSQLIESQIDIVSKTNDSERSNSLDTSSIMESTPGKSIHPSVDSSVHSEQVQQISVLVTDAPETDNMATREEIPLQKTVHMVDLMPNLDDVLPVTSPILFEEGFETVPESSQPKATQEIEDQLKLAEVHTVTPTPTTIPPFSLAERLASSLHTEISEQSVQIVEALERGSHVEEAPLAIGDSNALKEDGITSNSDKLLSTDFMSQTPSSVSPKFDTIETKGDSSASVIEDFIAGSLSEDTTNIPDFSSPSPKLEIMKNAKNLKTPTSPIIEQLIEIEDKNNGVTDMLEASTADNIQNNDGSHHGDAVLETAGVSHKVVDVAFDSGASSHPDTELNILKDIPHESPIHVSLEPTEIVGGIDQGLTGALSMLDKEPILPAGVLSLPGENVVPLAADDKPSLDGVSLLPPTSIRMQGIGSSKPKKKLMINVDIVKPPSQKVPSDEELFHRQNLQFYRQLFVGSSPLISPTQPRAETVQLSSRARKISPADLVPSDDRFHDTNLKFYRNIVLDFRGSHRVIPARGRKIRQ